MRNSRWAPLVALLLAVTGCSTVPSSSATVQITDAPSRPSESVGIEPLPPEPGATPEEIVRGFIEASASTRPGHLVAKQHLTPRAATGWSDEGGITVLSPDFATVAISAGSVALTANPVGTVDARGVFTVGGTGIFTKQFNLEKVKGEWRISDPPNGLILLEPDFERLYAKRDVFFLDPTRQRVVPDPRLLIEGDAQPTALVQRILDGPSGPIAAGVRNALTGVQLRNAVTVTDQSSAVVDLTMSGHADDPAPVLSEICAQIVWTLAPLAQTVEIRVDGEPVNIDGVPPEQTREDWAAFDPDAVPLDAVGHYLSGGAVHTVPAGAPSPGPAGTGVYGLTSAAVSADPRTSKLSFLVGVHSDATGAVLYAGPYDKDLAQVLTASTITAPTVAATRSEAWVVRDGTDVVRVPAGAAPQAVSAPTLAGLGRADVLRLSPDGVRAALVVAGPAGSSLYIGTVVRAEDGSVELRDLRGIAPTLSQVVDVAWRDSGSVVVLASDQRQDRIDPYSLGVDGWAVANLPSAGLPSQPESIAAAPTRQPLVNAGGTIWQLAGGKWATLERGAEPLPGTAPFYPL